jgi:polysaccharide deacetylase family protein (PEP-CTERM system associated)
VLAAVRRSGRAARPSSRWGWVAERHPALVRGIVAAGHELASHGCTHVPRRRAGRGGVSGTTSDASSGRSRTSAACRCAAIGAASFSIGARNLWAFPVLAEEGYRYSSSVYPVHHDLYGMPSAPRFAFRIAELDGFVELPHHHGRLVGRKLPCGGGGYFRLLPYALSRQMLRAVNRTDGEPCTFYFHPWEIDPGQPRQRRPSWRSRLGTTPTCAHGGQARAPAARLPLDRLDVVHACVATLP